MSGLENGHSVTLLASLHKDTDKGIHLEGTLVAVNALERPTDELFRDPGCLSLYDRSVSSIYDVKKRHGSFVAGTG